MNYIGKKGYTIPKSSLTQRELIDLKNDLWLKPQINGKQFAAQNQIPSFPVYRENDKKYIFLVFMVLKNTDYLKKANWMKE